MSPADADRQYQVKRGRKNEIDEKVKTLEGRINELNSGIANGNVGTKIANFAVRIFKSIDLHFTKISQNSLDRNITQLKESLPERNQAEQLKEDNKADFLKTKVETAGAKLKLDASRENIEDVKEGTIVIVETGKGKYSYAKVIDFKRPPNETIYAIKVELSNGKSVTYPLNENKVTRLNEKQNTEYKKFIKVDIGTNQTTIVKQVNQHNNTPDFSTLRQNIIHNANAYQNITLPQLKTLVTDELLASFGEGYSELSVGLLLDSLSHPDLGSNDFIVVHTSEIPNIQPNINTPDFSTLRQNIIDNANAYQNITLPQLKMLVTDELLALFGEGYSEKNVEFLLGSLSHPDLGSDDYIQVDTREIPNIPPDDIQIMRDFKYHILKQIKTSPTMTQDQIETEINNFVNKSEGLNPARAENIKATLKKVVNPQEGLNLQERLILIDALWDRWLQS